MFFFAMPESVLGAGGSLGFLFWHANFFWLFLHANCYAILFGCYANWFICYANLFWCYANCYANFPIKIYSTL